MKAILTLEGAPSELARILNSLGGATALTTTVAMVGASAPETTAVDDDESGDADAAPGTVDASGLPWDARIHSTPAKLTAKKVWRKRKGATDGEIAAVEAELRARGSAPVQVQQPAPQQPVYQAPTQPVPQYQPPVQQPQQTTQPVPQYQPPAPQQPVYQPPVQQPQPVQAGPMDFNGFMGKVQQMLPMKDANGGAFIDANYLGSVAARVGAAFNAPVNSITDLAGNQQFVDYAVQIMASEGRWV